MSLKDEIAKAKAAVENAEPTDLDVELNGKLKTLKFRPVLGGTWDDLVVAHPPRDGAEMDKRAGYNTDALPANYPVEKITVDDETPDEEDWRDLFHTLSSPNRHNIAMVLWGINRYEQEQTLIALGKARRG